MAYKYTDAVFELTAKTYTVTIDGEDVSIPYSKIDHAVLHHLAHRADKETGECFCGYSDISDHAHISRDAAINSIEVLEYLRFITVTRRGKKCNSYVVHLDRLIEAVGEGAAKTLAAKRTKEPSQKFMEKIKGVVRRTKPLTLPLTDTETAIRDTHPVQCVCELCIRPSRNIAKYIDDDDRLL